MRIINKFKLWNSTRKLKNMVKKLPTAEHCNLDVIGEIHNIKRGSITTWQDVQYANGHMDKIPTVHVETDESYRNRLHIYLSGLINPMGASYEY